MRPSRYFITSSDNTFSLAMSPHISHKKSTKKNLTDYPLALFEAGDMRAFETGKILVESAGAMRYECSSREAVAARLKFWDRLREGKIKPNEFYPLCTKHLAGFLVVLIRHINCQRKTLTHRLSAPPLFDRLTFTETRAFCESVRARPLLNSEIGAVFSWMCKRQRYTGSLPVDLYMREFSAKKSKIVADAEKAVALLVATSPVEELFRGRSNSRTDGALRKVNLRGRGCASIELPLQRLHLSLTKGGAFNVTTARALLTHIGDNTSLNVVRSLMQIAEAGLYELLPMPKVPEQERAERRKLFLMAIAALSGINLQDAQESFVSRTITSVRQRATSIWTGPFLKGTDLTPEQLVAVSNYQRALAEIELAVAPWKYVQELGVLCETLRPKLGERAPNYLELSLLDPLSNRPLNSIPNAHLIGRIGVAIQELHAACVNSFGSNETSVAAIPQSRQHRTLSFLQKLVRAYANGTNHLSTQHSTFSLERPAARQ